MNIDEVTGGVMLLSILIALAAIVIYPFVKALLLHLATKSVKFQSTSYWKSFFCILFGIGSALAIQIIVMGFAFRPGTEIDINAMTGLSFFSVFSSLFFVPVVETISLYLFFKESVGKTIGAIALMYLYFIGLGVVFFVIFILFTTIVRSIF